jgi:hypothetical protein
MLVLTNLASPQESKFPSPSNIKHRASEVSLSRIQGAEEKPFRSKNRKEMSIDLTLSSIALNPKKAKLYSDTQNLSKASTSINFYGTPREGSVANNSAEKRAETQSVSRHPLPSLDQNSLRPKMKSKRIQVEAKIPLKEASRNKEWTIKMKIWAEKLWNSILLSSNGLEIQIPEHENFTYKYFVGKGNNSSLIKKCFSNRSWWSQVTDPGDAHFIWTQWREKRVIEQLPCAENHPTQVDKTFDLRCPVRYQLGNKMKPVDVKKLGFHRITKSKHFANLSSNKLQSGQQRMHNRLPCNYHLSNKKCLYYNVYNYYLSRRKDISKALPLTFHIAQGVADSNYAAWEKCYNEILTSKGKKSVWIIKPGENSNRGNGIEVSDSVEEIRSIISNNQKGRSWIVQKYIRNPYLINKRKFDIRCYALVTSLNGVTQGYFYKEGYLRTTSCDFDPNDVKNKFMHLTNDAVQKHCPEYGKFESGNKLNYKEFQKYLESTGNTTDFYETVLPKIKQLIKHSIEAVFNQLNPDRKYHTFELLGYDFLLDSKLNPYLIEANTNPCLELSSPYLSCLIPAVVENAIRIAVDPVFPSPNKHKSLATLSENRFELVFHEARDGQRVLRNRELSGIREENDLHDSFEEEEKSAA